MEVVRKLDLEDIDQMVELRVALQDYDSSFDGTELTEEKRSKFKENTIIYLKNHLNKDLYMFGMFINEELVANCGFCVDNHFPTYNNESGRVGFISNVFTKEKYRGHGYQKKIFEKCLEYANELGITRFKLSSVNEKAINMYESFGFVKSNHTYSMKVKV